MESPKDLQDQVHPNCGKSQQSRFNTNETAQFTLNELNTMPRLCRQNPDFPTRWCACTYRDALIKINMLSIYTTYIQHNSYTERGGGYWILLPEKDSLHIKVFSVHWKLVFFPLKPVFLWLQWNCTKETTCNSGMCSYWNYSPKANSPKKSLKTFQV